MPPLPHAVLKLLEDPPASSATPYADLMAVASWSAKICVAPQTLEPKWHVWPSGKEGANLMQAMLEICANEFVHTNGLYMYGHI